MKEVPQADISPPDPIAARVGLDLHATDRAYVLGRAFALLEEIQFAAQGRVVKNSLRARFLSMATMRPAAAWQYLLPEARLLLVRISGKDATAATLFEQQLGGLLAHVSTFPQEWEAGDRARFLLAAHKQRYAYILSRAAQHPDGGAGYVQQGVPQGDKRVVLTDELAAGAIARPFQASTAGERAVAARVGANIRGVREKRGISQAQLALPEFSVSFISAVESGDGYPSLTQLTILARRLDVTVSALLQGVLQETERARVIGHAPSAGWTHGHIDLALLQASILIQQRAYQQADEVLIPLQSAPLTTEQLYRLSLLQGQMHLAAGDYQEAVVVLQAAFSQGTGHDGCEYGERARNLLGTAHHALHHYALALEQHLHCMTALQSGQIRDPLFRLTVYNNLAADYFQLGDLEQAVTYSHRILLLSDEMGKDRWVDTYLDISFHYTSVGNLTLAREYALRGLALAARNEEQRLIAERSQQLASALAELSLRREECS